MPESLFWCFLVNFAKFVRTPFLQNSTGRLLLIIAVSIVVKGVLANETVNYDTKALRKKCPNSKSSYYGVNCRIQSYTGKYGPEKNSVFRHFTCSETKTCSVLKNFVNSTGKHLSKSSEQKLVRPSVVNIRFSEKKVFAAPKIQNQPPQVFCKRSASRASVFFCEYCKILKNTYLEKYL